MSNSDHLEETNEHRLKQRQKQIDFGKNTTGYQNYQKYIERFSNLFPSAFFYSLTSLRSKRNPRIHIATPDIHRNIAKRKFDTAVREWRLYLHTWDNVDHVDAEGRV